jgi:hypothetical protein
MPAERLLELPVRLNGIPLGQPVDIVLDLERKRVIGLEVLCGDDARRYLPLAAARVDEEEIAIDSALLLFEERDLAWYRRRATTLGVLRSGRVRRRGRDVGVLAGLVVEADGAIPALTVEKDGLTWRLTFDEQVAIEAPGSATAA